MSQVVPAVPADETFDGTWPFRARYSETPGFPMHYVEEGSRPETLLLLHGGPTGMGLATRHPDRIKCIVSVTEPTPAGQPDLIERLTASAAASWLDAYRTPFPTPIESVGAIGWAKGFATGAYRFEQPDPPTMVELAKKPALAIWGEADRTLQAEHFLPLFNQAFPSGHVHLLPGADHYSPEDAPEDAAHRVTEFVAAC